MKSRTVIFQNLELLYFHVLPTFSVWKPIAIVPRLHKVSRRSDVRGLWVPESRSSPDNGKNAGK